MSLKKYVKIYQELSYLIENESTGTLKHLAVRFNVSTRQVANYVKDFRALGNEITYSKTLKSYVFVR